MSHVHALVGLALLALFSSGCDGSKKTLETETRAAASSVIADRRTAQPSDQVVKERVLAWKAATRAAAPRGEIVVREGEAVVTLVTELHRSSVFDLMDAISRFPDGRALVAWSGLHEVPVGYLRGSDYDAFRTLVAKRGLPSPQGHEPSYDLLFENPATGRRELVIMIHEDYAGDPATLAREACYATCIRDFYDSETRGRPIAVSPAVSSAFDSYLQANLPDVWSDTQRRHTARDVLTRLFCSLKGRRILYGARQAGFEVHPYYAARTAGAEELRWDFTTAVRAMIKKERQPYVIYYGWNLLPWSSGDHSGVPIGFNRLKEAEAWVESLDGAVLDAKVRALGEALNVAITPFLTPSDPRYYSHMKYCPNVER